MKYLHGKNLIDAWEEYLKNNTADTITLYIDYPFCRSVCNYCVFSPNVYGKSHKVIPKYEKAVIKQLREYENILKENPLSLIEFGGGTPTLWTEETMLTFKDIIPGYMDIPRRKIEVHPYDLTESKIDFLTNKMKFNSISVGVQSFDRASNKHQNRIWLPKEEIKHRIHSLQEQGVYVSVDLVALFGPDKEAGWKIFEDDLDYLINQIKPDGYFLALNYKTTPYLTELEKFRKLVSSFDCHDYIMYNDEYLTTDYNLMKYQYRVMYIWHKPYYRKFLQDVKSYEVNPKFADNRNNVTIGIGGYNTKIVNHRIGFKDIFSRYDDYHDRFINIVSDWQPDLTLEEIESGADLIIGTHQLDKL